jgi:benzoyl-CoA-dihydrodiol lyase
MADAHSAKQPTVRFETHPSRYVHFKLTIEGAVARLALDVQEDKPLRPGYQLKQNSYDLGVDIELCDAITRLRFEHPDVRSVVVTSDQPKIFCAGANIYMLGSSTHGFKVNFCKYTNETRIALEEACAESGQHYIAALNGVAAGGGYELALACEHIMLCDDGSSAVSFPETPLLAVLPGTGGLTRLVDKRRVRRDLADVFSSMSEGVRGKRAKDWGLVDEVIPRSKFDEAVITRANALAATKTSARPERKGPGVALPPLEANRYDEEARSGTDYRYVSVAIPKDKRGRLAEITMLAPDDDAPKSADEMMKRGAALWHLQAFRELDDALLDLRFNHPDVGLVLLKTRGDMNAVRAHDEALAQFRTASWFAHEVFLHVRRVLRRLDLTAKSLFAIVEPESCFAGSMFELAIASDRIYARSGDEQGYIAMSSLNFTGTDGLGLTMSNGLTRLATRFLATPEKPENLRRLASADPLSAEEALDEGLVTFAPDDIDWEDEVRLAVEERLALSPDALTGMEANLRFAGPETMETKIFARLSAWQNWIFQRPNAVGARGALTMYGRPERPEFDFVRT